MNKFGNAMCVAALGLTAYAGTADAATVYEGFDYDAGTSINGANGGVGFSGAWAGTPSRGIPQAVAPGQTWGALDVTGNSARSTSWNAAFRTLDSSLANAGLLGNGSTLWFSVIYDLTNQNLANADLNMSLGTNPIFPGPSGSPESNGGRDFGKRQLLNTDEAEGIGLTHSRGTIQGIYWQDNGNADNNAAERNVNNSSLSIGGNNPGIALIAGKIEWGADDLADEKLTLYAPDLDLNLGTPIMAEWSIPALDQSAFDILALQFKDNPQMDEIRFGATAADVLPSATVIPSPSAALAGVIGMGLVALRRRRG